MYGVYDFLVTGNLSKRLCLRAGKAHTVAKDQTCPFSVRFATVTLNDIFFYISYNFL